MTGFRRRKRVKSKDEITYAKARTDARERYPTTAERRAYLKGFRLGWYGGEKPDGGNWPNATARGYWDGYGIRQDEKAANS